MAGLLDFDPMDQSQYAVSDDERKRIALTNLLLGAGAGIGGARRGQEFGGLAQGIASGGMMAQQALSDAQRAKWDKLKGAGAAMAFARDKQAYADDQTERQVLQNYHPPQSQPMTDMSPTPANAAALSAQPKPGMYDQLNALADAFQAQGLGKKAEQYREQAQKYAPQFDTTPRYGVDAQGNRVAYVMDKSGNTKQLPIGPDKEKLHFGSTGGMANVGYDQFTGAQQSGGTPVTMDAAQIAANQIAQANLRVSQGHLGLDQTKFKYQQQRDAEGGGADAIKPQPLHADERKQLQEFTSNLENISTLRKSFKTSFAGRGANGAFDVTMANALGSSASEDTQKLGNWWADYEKMVNLPERFAVFGASLTSGEKQAWDAARRVRPGADSKQVQEALHAMESIADRKLGGLRESLIADKRQPAAIDAIVNRSGSAQKQVVRRGTDTATGRRVVMYSDGSQGFE